MEREPKGFLPEKFQQIINGKHQWADRFKDSLFWARTGASVSIVVAATDMYFKPDFFIAGMSTATALLCFQISRDIINKRYKYQEQDYQEPDEYTIRQRGEEIHLNPLDNFSYLIYGEDSPS